MSRCSLSLSRSLQPNVLPEPYSSASRPAPSRHRIHLISERKRVIELPSLMFIRRIPDQSVRRRRIRHWLLLCLRAAADRADRARVPRGRSC